MSASATQYNPGPNDYHVAPDGVLMPGLGADEPTADEKAGVRITGQKKINEMKEKLAEKDALLSEKDRRLIEKERALEARERAIEAAEKAAEKAAKAAAK